MCSKLSDNKTELLCVTRKGFRTMPVPPSLTIGECRIQSAKQVRNLDVMFVERMTMGRPGQCRVQFWSFPSEEHRHYQEVSHSGRGCTVCLVHALISPRLDQGNALLYGVPKYQGARVQPLQNLAARVVTRTQKHDHITPVLKSLHWLLLESRIQYKVLLLTFKAPHGLVPP